MTDPLHTPLAPGEARRATIPVLMCLCARCGHSWLAGRITVGAEPEPPDSCPSCKTRSWRTVPGSVKRGRPPKRAA